MSLTLIVSPISGGLFVSQIATMTAILETGVTVDAYFGNSGGAIANLIALKFNKTNHRRSMLRTLLRINKTMFTKPLVSTNNPLSSVLSAALSLLSSHLNKNGDGAITLIDDLFTESELRSTEFWIGRYNIKGNYNELVCSKSRSVLFELDTTYLRNINGTYNISYTDGNKDQIANAISASASIPGVKPWVIDDINNNLYWDGGIAMASPFTAFITSWYKRIVAKGEIAQIWYNMGSNYIDADIEYFNESAHWSSHLLTTIKWMINFTIQRERQVIYDMWIVIVGNRTVKTVKKTGKELKTFYPTIQNKYYFVTCYSSVTGINLTTFNRDSLEKEYNEAYESTTFEISYT